MKNRRASLVLIPVSMAIGIGMFINASATPAFARKEKKACAYCHLNPRGGGPRGFRGIYYQVHRLSFKGFKEKVEAKKAGVKPGSMGPNARPTKAAYYKQGWKHK